MWAGATAEGSAATAGNGSGGAASEGARQRGTLGDVPLPTTSPPRGRLGTALVAMAVLVLSLTACTTEVPEGAAVRVGAGSTVEQRVLGALTQVALEQTGLTVAVVGDLGDTVDVRGVALADDVDVYWDYTGAAWTLALGRALPPADPGESFEAVRAADDDNGLRWLGPSGADASLTFFVRAGERPAEDGATISWLAGQLGGGAGGLCADAEFLERPGGYDALAAAYAISTDLVPTTPTGTTKAMTAVATGECVAGLATTTSGTAVNAGLLPLRDDQGVFPALVLAPVVRTGGRADASGVALALEDLAGRLDSATLARLNAEVIAGADPVEVATDLLGG